jgi:predicted ATPase/DNA-binding SARP family transcriptional activator/DNA-binding CsgD family transcriptional regulator
MRLWLLGGFRVSVGTRTVEEGAWRLRKAASLVKLLALAQGHHLHREQAMDLLWPHHGRHAAANNLNQALHAARHALGPDDAQAASGYLASQGEQLVLCPAGELWVDVEAFEEAAETARRSREPAAYRAALDLYAGELLPRDPYEEWAEVPREGLRQSFLSLLVELGRLYEERGEYGSGIEALRRVLVEEATREEAHIGLMRLYALGGRQAEALAQFARLEESLSRKLGAEPQGSSRALREEIATGRFPPPNRPLSPPKGEIFDRPRHNLPATRTSFVGRDREIVEVKRALSMTRLLTLTGSGGSGKTRLALEVARDLLGAYPDGVWLVELAGLSEGDLVPQAVAAALGVKERPGQPLTVTLGEFLGAKQTLLVVDNCEHLLEATAALVDILLDSCSRLRILATSREALDVMGEVRWTVPPLSVPEPQGRPSSEDPSSFEVLEGYESVRLFVERARGRDPAFSLSPENAPAGAEICWRLEGIPLAIELAAARVGTLSLEQISERLVGSLELLTRGGRTTVPRQRTLKGTLDWSYELLSESEQTLFDRLSVFAGGWTLEAAEAVAAGEGVEGDEVLDLLSGLVEKSLVLVRGSGEGGARYRLLEPVRQYALEKLEESGEAEAAKRAHAQHFLALAEEAHPELIGPRDVEWADRLEAEHDNLRAALSWALEQREAELALRLAGALWRFWEARGHYGEGCGWLEAALAGANGASAAARAGALEGFGQLVHHTGDVDPVVEAAEEGLKLCDEAGLGGAVAANFLRTLGYTAQMHGHHERAKEHLEESLRLSRGADDGSGIASSLLVLGGVLHSLGDRERGMQLFEEGMALCREHGYVELLGSTLYSAGFLALLEGEYERGTALIEESEALFRERRYKGLLQWVLANLGWATLLQGDHERARSSFEESLTLCKELGDKYVGAESLEGMACVIAAEQASGRAARLFGAGRALREAGGYYYLPEEDALREPYLQAARSRLGEASWEAAFAEGQAMGFDEAVDYALSEDDSSMIASRTPKQTSTTAPRPAALTRREQEVAKLVARGLTNRQIAEELVLSGRTVENHVRSILKKLKLSSRSEVAAWIEAQRS